MRIIAPNRNDRLVDERGAPGLRFAAVLEDLAENVNNLTALPINTQDSNYTFVLEDAGQIIRKTSNTTLQTYTIPDNDSVTFEIGTQIEIQNDGSVSLTIAITTDTLTFSADGTTGSRTLAAAGEVRLVKVATTEWKIRGEGLT